MPGDPEGTLKPRTHHGSVASLRSPGGAGLTCGLVQALLGDVVVLADPLAITLEVDLRGGEGSAAQLHGLVLYDVGVLRLQQEVRQLFGGCGWVGVWEHLTSRVNSCGGRVP